MPDKQLEYSTIIIIIELVCVCGCMLIMNWLVLDDYNGVRRLIDMRKYVCVISFDCNSIFLRNVWWCLFQSSFVVSFLGCFIFLRARIPLMTSFFRVSMLKPMLRKLRQLWEIKQDLGYYCHYFHQTNTKHS